MVRVRRACRAAWRLPLERVEDLGGCLGGQWNAVQHVCPAVGLSAPPFCKCPLREVEGDVKGNLGQCMVPACILDDLTGLAATHVGMISILIALPCTRDTGAHTRSLPPGCHQNEREIAITLRQAEHGHRGWHFCRLGLEAPGSVLALRSRDFLSRRTE